jgi:glucokinase
VTLAAEQNDPAALAILDRAGRALGAAMGAFINIFNPEAIVVGGGLALSGEALLGPARDVVASYSLHGLRTGVHLLHATLGDDNGLLGAAALALDLSRNSYRPPI